MQAGLLTERIKILYSNIIKNEYGEEECEWLEKFSTRARLLTKDGNRLISNNQVVYDYRKELLVRSYVPVVEWDRILWNDRQYRILDIIEDKHLNCKTLTIELIDE